MEQEFEHIPPADIITLLLDKGIKKTFTCSKIPENKIRHPLRGPVGYLWVKLGEKFINKADILHVETIAEDGEIEMRHFGCRFDQNATNSTEYVLRFKIIERENDAPTKLKLAEIRSLYIDGNGQFTPLKVYDVPGRIIYDRQLTTPTNVTMANESPSSGENDESSYTPSVEIEKRPEGGEPPKKKLTVKIGKSEIPNRDEKESSSNNPFDLGKMEISGKNQKNTTSDNPFELGKNAISNQNWAKRESPLKKLSVGTGFNQDRPAGFPNSNGVVGKMGIANQDQKEGEPPSKKLVPGNEQPFDIGKEYRKQFYKLHVAEWQKAVEFKIRDSMSFDPSMKDIKFNIKIEIEEM